MDFVNDAGRAAFRVSVWRCALILLFVPSVSVQGQALCSAPHSSPVLARGGSIGTLAPGSGWIQVSVFGQRSARFFGPHGGRLSFPADGRVRIGSLYLTSGVGVLRGMDVWAQVPVHHVRYTDATVERSRSGVGDLRAALRISPAIVGADLPLAVRAGVKLPGSAFPVDATIIPLTEGQRDWELSVESGHTFFYPALYVMGWVGYRWREQNAAVSRDPGNEVFSHLAIGGTAGGLRWELASEVLIGGAPRLLGVDLSSGRRRLLQLIPTVGRRAGPGDLELSAPVPVAGRNLPTGAGLSLGYRLQWGQAEF